MYSMPAVFLAAIIFVVPLLLKRNKKQHLSPLTALHTISFLLLHYNNPVTAVLKHLNLT